MIFKKIKDYISLSKSNNIDTGLSSICYFSSSPLVLGHHFFVKEFLRKNNLKYFLFFFKQIFTISNGYNIKIYNKYYKYNQKKIFFTWGFKGNFDKQGNITDQYFRINSENKKILWVVLYLDKKIPTKISKNIILISLLNDNKIKSIIKSFFCFFKILFKKKLNFKKLHNELSFSSIFAENLSHEISKLVSANKINQIFMPYEGQPFQHYIPQQFKKINSKIKFFGYVSHNLPHSFDMFKRHGSPDYLFFHSKDQKNYFSKYLGWKKSELKMISSLRLKKEKKNKLNNKIFFSNQLNQIGKLIKNFQIYLSNSKNKSLPIMKINIHPRAYDKRKQLELKNKFENIIQKNRTKFNKKLKKNISIVIGFTSTPLYLLQNDINVLHIVENSFFQSYNSKYWPSIKSNKINDNIYVYSLLKNKKVLNISNFKSLNLLEKYLYN